MTNCFGINVMNDINKRSISICPQSLTTNRNEARKGTNAHLECKKTFITETRKGISSHVEETQRFGIKP
jgi:hypothetical protein